MSLWLPAQPFEALTADTVETFLAARHSESSVLEYKERASARNLPEDIAAFANTYGGLVIVGVPDDWDGNFDRLVDVQDGDLSSLQDRLVDTLSPPWVPPMKVVKVRGIRTGMVKVDLITAPRPLLVAGSAKFRAGDRNAPMSGSAQSRACSQKAFAFNGSMEGIVGGQEELPTRGHQVPECGHHGARRPG